MLSGAQACWGNRGGETLEEQQFSSDLWCLTVKMQQKMDRLTTQTSTFLTVYRPGKGFRTIRSWRDFSPANLCSTSDSEKVSQTTKLTIKRETGYFHFRLDSGTRKKRKRIWACWVAAWWAAPAWHRSFSGSAAINAVGVGGGLDLVLALLREAEKLSGTEGCAGRSAALRPQLAAQRAPSVILLRQ